MRKWLQDNIVSSLTLVAILGAAYYVGENKGRLWSSNESRIIGEKHIENTDELTVFKNRKSDSTQLEKRFKIQDSLYKVRDTVIQKNSVTIYQNKEKVDSVLKMMDRLNKNLEHTLEHIDQ